LRTRFAYSSAQIVIGWEKPNELFQLRFDLPPVSTEGGLGEGFVRCRRVLFANHFRTTSFANLTAPLDEVGYCGGRYLVLSSACPQAGSVELTENPEYPLSCSRILSIDCVATLNKKTVGSVRNCGRPYRLYLCRKRGRLEAAAILDRERERPVRIVRNNGMPAAQCSYPKCGSCVIEGRTKGVEESAQSFVVPADNVDQITDGECGVRRCCVREVSAR
jgi:hypothetical protein